MPWVPMGTSIGEVFRKSIPGAFPKRGAGGSIMVRVRRHFMAAPQHSGGSPIWCGRRRAVPQIHSRNPNERALGERIAINTVVQGSAADLIKLAMLHIHRDLPGRFPGARMLLQIHDELVFEIAEAQAAALDDYVRQAMEGAMPLRVPLEVSTSWASTWAQ